MPAEPTTAPQPTKPAPRPVPKPSPFQPDWPADRPFPQPKGKWCVEFEMNRLK
ncbi:MAG: hypothetical protein AAF939_19290 [Planctomycetota bacterium]